MVPCILATSKMNPLVGFRQPSMKFSYRPLRDLESPSSVTFLDFSHKLVPLRVFLLVLVVSFISVALNLATLYVWLYSAGPFDPYPQTLYCSSIRLSVPCIIHSRSPAPAQDALEYKTIKFHSGFGPDLPIYDQHPSDEVDKAWEGLYECASAIATIDFGPIRSAVAYSKIPRSQAVRLVNKTYPILGEPTTYMLALDVFHELHCLVNPPSWINVDY